MQLLHLADDTMCKSRPFALIDNRKKTFLAEGISDVQVTAFAYNLNRKLIRNIDALNSGKSIDSKIVKSGFTCVDTKIKPRMVGEKTTESHFPAPFVVSERG
jgi:hypothetical protein